MRLAEYKYDSIEKYFDTVLGQVAFSRKSSTVNYFYTKDPTLCIRKDLRRSLDLIDHVQGDG